MFQNKAVSLDRFVFLNVGWVTFAEKITVRNEQKRAEHQKNEILFLQILVTKAHVLIRIEAYVVFFSVTFTVCAAAAA